ncbi:hypothetical protein GP486_001769 [Trichoglossum hirsutum]|uniref:Uncharacterized protein n=1 Tax=Trichoglossum hirsutum TaxID=265104 RepID=A0A9P8LG28_9PEZI|nr:hypothetical protein GP486_001769 [Trichoglossum hirsutum]
MACTPTKSIRRVLQDVAVNVSGTPSKLCSGSSTMNGNKAVFSIEERENEGRLRGPFAGRKRTIDEVDGAVSEADIARPALDERVSTRSHNMLICGETANATDNSDSIASEATVVVETRESLPESPNTSATEVRTRSTPIQRSTLDLLAAPKLHISTPESRATAKKACQIRALDSRGNHTDYVQHAEMLRLRLKLAMYKVRTNQIYVPISELRLPPCELANSPRKLDNLATSPAPKTLPLQQTRPRPNQKLLPAPILIPTSYSARRIIEPYMPSSPPCSALNSDMDPPGIEGGLEEDIASPAAITERELLHPPMQLSSPPGSEKRIANAGRVYDAESGLTSSVAKGRAANGLLELMQS